jgi:hypothetical protein
MQIQKKITISPENNTYIKVYGIDLTQFVNTALDKERAERKLFEDWKNKK